MTKRHTHPDGRRNHTPGPVFNNLRGHLDALTARARGEASPEAPERRPRGGRAVRERRP
ncbi:hypothetical protein [Flexivirga sp. B27]